MACAQFKNLLLMSGLIQRRHEDSEFDAVDRYFVLVVDHILILQRKQESRTGTPPAYSLPLIEVSKASAFSPDPNTLSLGTIHARGTNARIPS